jgi:peptide deformylase
MININTNPDHLAILRTPARTVVGLTDDIRELINELANTCWSDPTCVALTANQIWTDPIIQPPAVFVIKMKDGILPFINPVIEKVFKKERDMKEKCMSVPGKEVRVFRPYHIIVSFIDGEGRDKTNEHMYDMMARIWLHEYDHIQGKLITDYE